MFHGSVNALCTCRTSSCICDNIMYLRESRRTNEDGSVVAYLQQTGNSVAKVIHNFGRADQVDRAALARLVASISR